MENSKEGNSIPTNPKPTDQLQMEIETVTPDTEKDVVPTVENNQSPKSSDEGQETKQDDAVSPQENETTADIETVVPDKAKAEATESKIDESDDLADGSEDNLDDDEEEVNDDETKLEQEEVEATKADNTEGDEGENEDENNEEESDDERDQIETVSP